MRGNLTWLTWIFARWRAWLVGGLALLALALAVRQVAASGTDSPTGLDWRVDGETIFLPWLDKDGGRFVPLAWIVREPGAGEWLWKLGVLHVNGQWDPRLPALAAAVVWAAAVGLLLAPFVGRFRPVSTLALGLSAGVWLSLPRVSLEAASPWSGQAAWLMLLGLAHLVGTVMAPRRPWGPVAGLLGALASTAGGASALALMAWALLRCALTGDRLRGYALTFGWNALLLAGVLVRALRSPDGVGWSGMIERAGAVLAWPFATPWAVVLVFPVGWHLWRLLRGREAFGETDWRVLALGLWLPGMALLFPPVTAGGVAWPAAMGVFAWCVHGLCLVCAIESAGGRWPRRLGLAVVWWVVAAHGAVDVSRDLPSAADHTVAGQDRAAAARRFMVTGERQELVAGLALAPVEAERAGALLRDVRFAPWLPVSVRAPLAVFDERTENTIFSADKVPELAALPSGYPAVGTWRAGNEGGSQGEWRSAPIATIFPLLQFHVAGQGRPATTTLSLAGLDGTTQAPLQPHFDAISAWKRVNVRAPKGLFEVILTDASPDDWLAVAAPVELARGTWLAGKAPGFWPPVLGVAVVLLGAALAGGTAAWVRQARTEGATIAAWGPVLRWGPWFAVGAYGVVLSGFLDTNAAGADSAGYLGNARLLLDGKITAAAREVPGIDADVRLHAPLGFFPRDDGLLAPIYPSGLSLMIAAAGWFLPLERAAALVIWLHLLAGVLLTRALARACGLPGGWAWLAATMVGLSPVYLFMGLQPMSDAPSLVWLTLAMVCALRSRDDLRWAVAAGAATAMTVLLRPANAIGFVPVLLCLGSWRAVAWWIVGAVPGACWQLWHAWSLFGSPFATGYGSVRDAFGAEWVGRTLGHYAVQLTVAFTPLIWLAFASPWARDVPGRIRGALGAWVLAYFGFYAFYYCTHETWWYLRFVLPAFPPLVILALLALRTLLRRCGVELFAVGRGLGAVAASVILVGVVATHAAVQARRLEAVHPTRGTSIYPEIAAWLQTNAPADAAIFSFQASSAIFHYTPLTVLRFDQVELSESRRVAAHLLETGRPVYAVMFPFDVAEAATLLPEGDWRLVGRVRDVEIRRLDALAPPAGGEN